MTDDNSAKLKGLILGKSWQLEQLRHSCDGSEDYWQEIYAEIPGILVMNFFKKNDIRGIEEKNNALVVRSVGYDHVPWKYRLTNLD